MKLLNSMKFLSLGLILGIALTGCGGGEDTTPPPAPAAPTTSGAATGGAAPKIALNSEAGRTLQPGALDMAALKQLGSETFSGSRPDPFALLASERKFETSQATARLLDEAGGMFALLADTTEKDDPADAAPITVPAPPGLRLAGVILANGVAALLEFEGRIIEIRPGMTIPGTEWKVASIDSEKAVLRREGNVLPREVVVPLASRLDVGGGGGGNAGGNAGGGNASEGRGRGGDPRGGGGGNAQGSPEDR